MPSNAQQSGIEIASTFALASFGATVTGVTGAVAAGMLISGCVFFICTEPDALGGSGRTVMRAVSFFGPGETDSVSVTGIAAALAAANGTDPPDGGRGVEVAVGCGGKNVGGGRGELGGGGVAGADGGEAGRFGTMPLAGGRDGRLIRTVSRLLAAASVGLGGTRGGSVIRTVSFFGSFGSAIGS